MGLIKFNLDRRLRHVTLWYQLLDAVEPFRGIRVEFVTVTMVTVAGWPQHVDMHGYRILKGGEDGAAASKIVWNETDAPAWMLPIIEQARRDFDA